MSFHHFRWLRSFWKMTRRPWRAWGSLTTSRYSLKVRTVNWTACSNVEMCILKHLAEWQWNVVVKLSCRCFQFETKTSLGPKKSWRWRKTKLSSTNHRPVSADGNLSANYSQIIQTLYYKLHCKGSKHYIMHYVVKVVKVALNTSLWFI